MTLEEHKNSKKWLSSRCLCLMIVFSSLNFHHCMDNGLALLPPMGWMSWMKYACNVDCQNYPNECISEQLYKDMIDRIAEDGWLELGYNTVNIDDCWEEHQRDPLTLQLVANRTRFPNGIRALSDYAASKGVQLGIYSDVGNKTCGGYPGTRDDKGDDFTMIDARTFRIWNVTSLKLDGCWQDQRLFNESYPLFSKALRKFAPNIVYACSWLAYLNVATITDEIYQTIRDNCNYWRNFDDIVDSWASVLSIIDFYGKYGEIFQRYHGPGGWFDADMLIIGNNGLSYEQSKTQMAFWSLWSVPLLMSNDLRNIRPEMKEILMNKLLISINQDPKGEMGLRVDELKTKNQEVWLKQFLHPDGDDRLAYAVIYFNRQVLGVPKIMSYRLREIIPSLESEVFKAYDVFNNPAVPIGLYKANSSLKLRVPTSGSVRMTILLEIDSQEL